LLNRIIDIRLIDSGSADQSSDGFAMFCDDNLFASRHLFEQRGEMGFGLKGPNGDHRCANPSRISGRKFKLDNSARQPGLSNSSIRG
jgi:hypothetical protein